MKAEIEGRQHHPNKLLISTDPEWQIGPAAKKKKLQARSKKNTIAREFSQNMCKLMVKYVIEYILIFFLVFFRFQQNALVTNDDPCTESTEVAARVIRFHSQAGWALNVDAGEAQQNSQKASFKKMPEGSSM